MTKSQHMTLKYPSYVVYIHHLLLIFLLIKISVSFVSIILLNMKSSHFIFLCLLTTLVFVHLFSQHITTSSTTSFPGRRFMMEFKMSTPKYEHYTTVRNVDKESMMSSDELVYHIDYHGVTTHPSPTPKHTKHPKP